jgi:uncharacterized cupredoxin-like copper-binding protein
MPSPTFRRRHVTAGAVTLIAAAGLMLGACGTTAEAGPEADDAATEAQEPTAPSTTATTATVEVSAIDYAYEDLPATLAAGTRIVLHNDSTSEMHELIAMRLPDDETRPVEDLLELPQAELESMFTGEPAAVILAPPGEDGFPVVGDGVISEPGRYIVICAIPTGADPEAYLNAPEGEGPPVVDGGPPHFVNGMWAELVVEAE